MLFLRVHEIKKHLFLFHYGKHKQIDGNHNQRTSMLAINVLFSRARSIIVGYWKHFLCFQADKKNMYIPNKNVWLWAALTLHLFSHGAHKLNQYNFLLLNKFLTLILSIKASISGQEVQCLMESLRDNFNKIVQKALTMEDSRIKDEPTVTDYMTILQSQPMYDSDNAVD